MEHSKYYYDYTRNCSCDECVCGKKEKIQTIDNRVPEYYVGKNGYEARKVCDNFDLPYHLATATTYILRAYHKHDTPIDCLTKAIAHLEFEIEKYKDNRTKDSCCSETSDDKS